MARNKFIISINIDFFMEGIYYFFSFAFCLIQSEGEKYRFFASNFNDRLTRNLHFFKSFSHIEQLNDYVVWPFDRVACNSPPQISFLIIRKTNADVDVIDNNLIAKHFSCTRNNLKNFQSS